VLVKPFELTKHLPVGKTNWNLYEAHLFANQIGNLWNRETPAASPVNV